MTFSQVRGLFVLFCPADLTGVLPWTPELESREAEGSRAEAKSFW